MTSRDSTTDIAAGLNEPQRQAVLHRDGPLLVLAGPGSGKTRVITRRAAQLVASGVSPHNILAITFTNKAADEMRLRIAALGVDRGMWVYTFHALGVRLLREFGRIARVEPGFTIYDDADQTRLVKEAMQLCQISDQIVKPDAALRDISRAKNALQTPHEYLERAEHFEHRNIARIYEAYEQLLEQRNAVDFDDLLMRVAVVLRNHPDIAERLNGRFQYLLIDEYQDTNHAQYLIAKYLSQHHRNICATGDPDQSIYAWRGADLTNILEFERDYPDAAVVRLEENYRSTKAILRAASKLIACNKRRRHKDLWTSNNEGAPVAAWEFNEDRDEANHIARVIKQQHEDGRSYSDFAIMYRVNAVSRGLEEALRHHGVPYRIARGVEFYNRAEIRDTLAYLRLVVNPADALALLRIINTPTRGIGDTSVKRLRAAAEQTGRTLWDVVHDPETVESLGRATRRVREFANLLDKIAAACQASVADAVRSALELSGLERALQEEGVDRGEDRIANVQELVTAAARYDDEVAEPSLEDFLQRVCLTSDQDAIDESVDAVLLLTLHAAKGLEFPVVFIAGLEQGMLPHERAIREGDVEEERRLAFVGVTRAQQQLTLSHARQRYIRGVVTPRAPSQFLAELPDDAVTAQQFGLPRRQRASEDGFVPLDDQLPPDEFDQRRPTRRRRGDDFAEGDEPVINVALERAREQSDSPFADWQAGALVRHPKYGVGQVVWLRPGGGQTRAAIRFPRLGEKTFILEVSPITRLQR